jgi:cytochrome c-type biogenesis protein CcmF
VRVKAIDQKVHKYARSLAQGQFLFISIAFILLIWAYVVSDFSVLNVAVNSHSSKPLLYKIAGVWANHEGSLILWVWILSFYGFVFSILKHKVSNRFSSDVLAIVGFVTAGITLYVLFKSNPFIRLYPVPENGQGLNPLLQDPALSFHPPCLYLGYVGFTLTFAVAVATMLNKELHSAWASEMRFWTLTPWVFLTIGIAMGSWWAYYELGWGGWWFWDPVENASLMPWLMATALLHSAIVAEKRSGMQIWSLLLAILTFTLSLLGTFLVRSGLIMSVHNFASDPERGMFIIIMIAVFIIPVFVLFLIKSPSFKSIESHSLFSKETALTTNNVLFVSVAFFVLIGTFYPLYDSQVSLGPSYYNSIFMPVFLPILLLMAAAPFMSWGKAILGALFQQLRLIFIVAVGLALLLGYALGDATIYVSLGLFLGFWVIILSIKAWVLRIKKDGMKAASFTTHGLFLAHLGIGITVLGIVVSVNWKQESSLLMTVGQRIDFAGISWKFEGLDEIEGPNYLGLQARFDVRDAAGKIATMVPERRIYPVEQKSSTEVAIHSNLLRDLYLVLGEEDQLGRGWRIQMNYNPLVPWIWIGALISALGGLLSLLSLFRRRKRI